MVALQKNADIEAEDALEGLLPLTIADGRVIINSGYLRALPPGGRNPALHDGQSIRFDINVEQNLDPLLQSLRIGDNLQQRIEGGMQ